MTDRFSTNRVQGQFLFRLRAASFFPRWCLAHPTTCCVAIGLFLATWTIVLCGPVDSLPPRAPLPPMQPDRHLYAVDPPPRRFTLADYVDFAYLLPPDAHEARAKIRDMAKELFPATGYDRPRARYVQLSWEDFEFLSSAIPLDATAARAKLSEIYPPGKPAGYGYSAEDWDNIVSSLRDVPPELRFLFEVEPDERGYHNVAPIEHVKAIDRLRQHAEQPIP